MAAVPPVSEPRRRLLADVRDGVLAAGTPYRLALAGDHALHAHGLVRCPGRELEVATEHAEDMGRIVTVLRAGLWERGWQARVWGTGPLSARLVVTEPESGEECEVGVAKEVLWRAPVRTGHGLALSLEDAVGIKVRALAEHGLVGDLVGVRAAAHWWSLPELEELGRRHARDTFDLTDLHMRLTGTDWVDDTDFAVHGLDTAAIEELRRWAQGWADEIGEQLCEAGAPEEE
ncbi:hypothetical protein [Streptomyces sp. NPDC094149]|uniref:hypothetical protein n=1 Tax=Streptomyces sp. NPDC094149 TaxID=3155079 RepID=UPI003318DC4F